MGSPEDIIEEEGNRLLEEYFDIDKIKNSKNPHKEFLNQLKKLKQLGFVQLLKEKYRIANMFFKKIKIKNKRGKTSLNRKEFKKFNFGAIQKSLTAALKGAVQRTGKRQIISTYKGKIKAFEKWRNVGVINVKRNKLGQFTEKWNN